MPSEFANQLIQQFGGVDDYRFSAAVQLKTATILSSSNFASVLRFEPWTNTQAKELLKHHPVAIWTSLEVRLAPRAGIFGRMCTFYGGWAAVGAPAPSTVEDMVALHNAVDVTYGGTGDPGTIKITIPCQFDATMQDVLKSPYGDQGRPVFYYCFVEQPIIDKVSETDRFMLTFRGSFILKGRY